VADEDSAHSNCLDKGDAVATRVASAPEWESIPTPPATTETIDIPPASRASESQVKYNDFSKGNLP